MTRSSGFYLIFIDSLCVDSSQYGLFGAPTDTDGIVKLSATWGLTSVDTLTQTMTFGNCNGENRMSVVLRKDQITSIVSWDAPWSISRYQAVNDLVVIPLGFIGMLGVAAGAVTLPFSSHRTDSAVMIGAGVGYLGLAVLVGYLNGDNPRKHVEEREKLRIVRLRQ